MLRTVWYQLRQVMVATSAAMLLALVPLAAHADDYGSGPYGSGLYGSGTTSSSSSGSSSAANAAQTKESTVVQTPSGLEVAINLADGQAIPSTGYYITITPINSNGRTFDKAEIYLDGTLMFTGTPDATGTLKWFWDTSKYPATKVKIIVYGPGEGSTTHEFNVTVTPVQSTSSTTQQPTTSLSETASSGWPAWLMWVLSGSLLLLIILILWFLARRHHRQSPPPYTPTPMS